MELSDYKMLYDYNECEKFLATENIKISELKNKLNILGNDASMNIYHYIIEDIWFMLDTFVMYEISCECREGLNQKFFPLTSFTRSNLETLNIILGKINELIKSNRISSNDILSVKYNDICKKLGIGRNLRNKLEHEKDPYYDGRLGEIEKNFDLIKQLEFVENTIELCELLRGKTININQEVLVINFNELPLTKRKELTTEIAHDSARLFRYVSEFSYIISDRTKNIQPTSDIEKVIIDLGFKLIELNKAITFLYNKTLFTELQSKMHTTPDEYFCKISLFKAYQVCDKLGFYIAYYRCYNLKETYFKKVVDRLNQDNQKPHLKIESAIIKFRIAPEYDVVNKIRNFLEHKNGRIDYSIELEKIHSLIVVIHNNLTRISLEIFDKYCDDNSIVLSERSLIETMKKNNYIDI